MTRVPAFVAASAIALTMAACDFRPTAPFGGFDGQGSRVIGRFEPGAGSSALQTSQTVTYAASAGVQGIEVMCEERPSLKVAVDQNGAFTIAGVPAGSFTLVFLRDGQRIGEIRLKSVRKNQGITITLNLTSGGEVILVKEERDQVSFSGECPRGAGFWCQNRGGQNPNLSKAEFDAFALEAASLLQSVPAVDTPDEIAGAICNTGNQFVRQLATLALNLAAKTVTVTTALQGEPAYATVGDAFKAAVAHLTGAQPLGAAQQDTLKDVMDRINNAQNVSGCDQLPDDDDGDDDPPDTDPPASGQITICHIPPGNYNARQTVTIDASAWPAHKGHCNQGTCDYQGACQ
jgi:hypothetical protein